ncbi:MAG: PilZ domain-containing protein [Kineosporiaceae bacterium]
MRRDEGLTERVAGPHLELPRVNALVRVAIGVGPDPDGAMRVEDVASRIEDRTDPQQPFAPERLLLAAPRYAGDSELPRPGTACWVSWPTQRGLMDLPVAFVGAEYAREKLAAWWVEVTGAAVRTERRRFFRVTLQLPLELRVPDLVLTGHVVDLSEGGLRCLLPSALDAAGLVLGDEVEVAFTPEGHSTLALSGIVVRLLPGPTRTDPREVGLRFLDTRAYADVMRRVVYDEQLRARRRVLL